MRRMEATLESPNRLLTGAGPGARHGLKARFMGRIAWLVALCVLSLVVRTHSAEHIRIAGKEYVSIPDWARSRGLDFHWLKRDETVQAGNTLTKIVLSVDSREAQVNGIGVWLSFPIVLRNGTVYLAQLDAQTTLEPLLSEPRTRAGNRVRTICLDPGHGGKDPGNRVGSNEEKKYTLLLAQEVRDQLTRAGLKVTLTRTTDTFIELPTRA